MPPIADPEPRPGPDADPSPGDGDGPGPGPGDGAVEPMPAGATRLRRPRRLLPWSLRWRNPAPAEPHSAEWSPAARSASS
jgi:hypothetical protein